jgi:glutamyl-tRNA synthetase
MKISHVIRGEEWLPSAPLHVLLYRAFGWEDTMPQFAHLSLLLKPDGNGKLSKRDGDRLGFPVFPLEWRDPKTGDISSGYRESGYLPEAVINFLALLGWNPGNNQEVMSLDELVELFNIEKCSKSGAKFDYEKGKYFNHLYLQKKSDAELAKIVQAKLDELNIIANSEKVEMAVAAMKERATFTNDLWDLCAFFFVAPTTFNEKDVQKRWKTDTSTLLSDLLSKLETMDSFDDAEKTEEEVKTWCETKGYGLGSVMNPFRLTLVGEMKGPQMFLITKILGKDEVVKRLKYALITING